MHYFKSMRAANSAETGAVLAAMRQMPVNDMATKDGHIRADGMVERQIYLLTGKTPAESKEPWDLLKLVETLPKEVAFPRPREPKCYLLRS
jgi:branched-chain amino acid transport system substrate-binding protein